MKNLKFVFTLSSLLILTGCFNKITDIKVHRDQARVAYDDTTAKYTRELQLISKIKALDNSNSSNKLDRKDNINIDTMGNINTSTQSREQLGQALHHEILLKHEEHNRDVERQWLKFNSNKYENYPYMQYRADLDQQIQDLETIGSAVYWKHEGLGRSLQDLIQDLNELRRYIILHKEYSLERRLLEKKALLKEAQE
ncbi:MAG TPA: hypothetical protein VJJ81_03385 [Candidatus Babeliales bacterium]|nr:hypothetical protein [Candidatus Babeliales bacterium]